MTDLRSTQVYVLFTASLALILLFGLPLQAIDFIWGLAATELLFILLPAIIFVWWKRLPIGAALRWKPVKPFTAVLCLAVGIGTWGIVAGVNDILMRLIGYASSVDPHPFIWTEWLALIAVAAVLPAICEESLFRGAIQGTLRRSGTRRAIVITAMLFAAFHLNPNGLIPLFLMGLSYGIICWRTNSSVSSMLAHFANNAMAVTAPRVFQSDAESFVVWMMVACALLALLAFPLFWINTRGIPLATPVLAGVPASMTGRGLLCVAVVGAASFVVWIGTAIAAGIFLLLFINMPDDSMTPTIESNDRLVILKSEYISLNLKSGDLVAVQIDDTLTIRQVTEVCVASIRVADNRELETEISLAQAKGKLIFNFKRPAGSAALISE